MKPLVDKISVYKNALFMHPECAECYEAVLESMTGSQSSSSYGASTIASERDDQGANRGKFRSEPEMMQMAKDTSSSYQ